MNKFIKYTLYAVSGTVAAAYLSFLFVLPNVINLNKYKPEVQKLTKEQAKLNVNFENIKIITTPLLGVGIKADNISVKLPDNSTLFSADGIKTRISIPSLLLLTVKISCLDIQKPFVNLEIVNDENFKIVKLVEDILNEGKERCKLKCSCVVLDSQMGRPELSAIDLLQIHHTNIETVDNRNNNNNCKNNIQRIHRHFYIWFFFHQ